MEKATERDMTVMQAVDQESALMVAWNRYKASPHYANTRRWANRHTEGSLWAAFEMGWMCAKEAADDAQR